MTGLAEKIRLLRAQAGMTQAALAERLEVSRQTVSKWELGSAQPELDKLAAISELFHVSADYLLRERSVREPMSLDRLALRFLGCAQDLDAVSGELVRILRDGVIDETEQPQIREIAARLDELSRTVETLRYSLLEHKE